MAKFKTGDRVLVDDPHGVFHMQTGTVMEVVTVNPRSAYKRYWLDFGNAESCYGEHFLVAVGEEKA